MWYFDILWKAWLRAKGMSNTSKGVTEDGHEVQEQLVADKGQGDRKIVSDQNVGVVGHVLLPVDF